MGQEFTDEDYSEEDRKYVEEHCKFLDNPVPFLVNLILTLKMIQSWKKASWASLHITSSWRSD